MNQMLETDIKIALNGWLSCFLRVIYYFLILASIYEYLHFDSHLLNFRRTKGHSLGSCVLKVLEHSSSVNVDGVVLCL